MDPYSEKKCPDCTFTMRSIKLFGRGFGTFMAQDAALYYAAGDADRGSWSGRYSIAGGVKAYLCQKCGRILLYGQSDGTPLE